MVEKCISCENRFDNGDKYINEPIFGDKLCVECIPELRMHLKDAEDWHSLSQLDDGGCEEKEFVNVSNDEVIAK